MLQTLKELFNAVTAPSGSPADEEHQLQLATAVLLVEVMRADPQIHARERAAVLRPLGARFDLARDELARLVELAEQTAGSASDFQQFTSVLNDRFGQDDKIRIVENMWAVAYADGHLEATENHVISKVAGLLHVTHGEYIAAKLRAKEAAPPLKQPPGTA